MNPFMTIIKGCKSKNTKNFTTMLSFVKMLQSDDMKKKITAYREEQDQAKRTRMKENLPAVVPSGLLSDRKTLIRFSGLICVDFDHIGYDKAEEIKKSEFMPNWVYLAFTSPSGDGLKVFVPIWDSDEFDMAFDKISKKFMQIFDIESDKNCKGLVRLCFASYDPNLYFNSTPAHLHFEQHERVEFKKITSEPTKERREERVTPVLHNEFTMVKPLEGTQKMTPWEVIQATQPSKQGERTGKLKLLARGLKFNAGITSNEDGILEKYVVEWVNMCGDRIATKDIDENLNTFRTFYNFAKKPLDAIRSDEMKAFQRAEAGIMPEECALFSSDTRRLLCAWMWNLRGADGKFFISCKTVAKRMNVSAMTAWNWILDIEFRGIIKRETVGHTGKASSYVWLGRAKSYVQQA